MFTLVIAKLETDTHDVLVLKLLKVLQPIEGEIALVTSNYKGIVHSQMLAGQPEPRRVTESRLPSRMLGYFRAHLLIAHRLWEFKSRADRYLFFTGGSLMFVPAIVARLSGRPLVIMATGLGHRSAAVVERGRGVMFARVLGLVLLAVEFGTLALAHRVAVESLRMRYTPPVKLFPSKVSVANLGIDPEEYSEGPPPEQRRFFGGFVGRLSYEKGADAAVRSFALLRESEHRFLIAGDGPLLNTILSAIRSNRLQDLVTFAGWVPPRDVPGLLREVKFLIHPSLTEGLPNVILEAMASRTIVLATAVGGVADVLEDGVTGFIIPGPQPDEIVRTLKRANASTDLEAIAARALTLVRDRYSIRAASASFVRLFSNATGTMSNLGRT